MEDLKNQLTLVAARAGVTVTSIKVKPELVSTSTQTNQETQTVETYTQTEPVIASDTAQAVSTMNIRGWKIYRPIVRPVAYITNEHTPQPTMPQRPLPLHYLGKPSINSQFVHKTHFPRLLSDN